MAATTLEDVIVGVPLMTAMITAVGWQIRKAVAKRSPRDRHVGWWVYGFAVAGYPAGAAWTLLNGADLPQAGGNFGLVAGTLLGLAVGNLVWFVGKPLLRMISR